MRRHTDRDVSAQGPQPPRQGHQQRNPNKRHLSSRSPPSSHSLQRGPSRAIVVARDGTVWVAASSADAIVRIGHDGVVSQFPLNESGTSVGKLVEGPDGRIWFEGFQVIGSIGANGDVDLRYVGIDPDGFATDQGGLVLNIGRSRSSAFSSARRVRAAGRPSGQPGRNRRF